MEYLLAVVAIVVSVALAFVRVKRGLEVDVVLKMGLTALTQGLALAGFAYAAGWPLNPQRFIVWCGIVAVFWFVQVVCWEWIGPAFIEGHVKHRMKEVEKSKEDGMQREQDAVQANEELRRHAAIQGQQWHLMQYLRSQIVHVLARDASGQVPDLKAEIREVVAEYDKGVQAMDSKE